MFRYKIVSNHWVTIAGGDREAFLQMMERDKKAIEALLKIIAKAETVVLKDLSELVLSTKDRPVVYFDVKQEFDLSHNEAQECLFAAIRIAKRRYAGKDDGMFSRVINARRLKMLNGGKAVKIFPQRIVLELQESVHGKVLSMQAFGDEHLLRLRFHLKTPRVEVRHPKMKRAIIGIDLGKKISLVVLRDRDIANTSNNSRNEIIVDAKHCTDVVEALAFVTRYSWKQTLVKIGLPGVDYRDVLDELYYRLLEQKYSVQVVNEAYTSVTCSSCLQRGTRVGRIFWCELCDLRLHADENAAVNIAHREKVIT